MSSQHKLSEEVSQTIYKVTITDIFDDVFELEFKNNEYSSLRALIAAHYPEEFGECKGRGLCGTCHVIATSGILNEHVENSEKEILKSKFDTTKDSRLACQIVLNEKINNMTFKIITEQ